MMMGRRQVAERGREGEREREREKRGERGREREKREGKKEERGFITPALWSSNICDIK